MAYNVRLATHNDRAACEVLAREFEAALGRDDVFSKDFYKDGWPKLYRASVNEKLCVVAEKDGKMVGMLGGIEGSFMFNPNKPIVQELMWWVQPDHRHTSVGIRLLKLFEHQAGDKPIHMTLLAGSPIKVSTMEKAGYQHIEQVFIKGI